tara:strand:- start:5722 stop:6879 length:1158 start_codon:yes stop_codon:yes gene_type:complete
MKGGKLLAEGGYGCVFSPGIDCDGSSTIKKYVSKIQRYDSSAMNEIKLGKIIQNINGFQDHFSPILKYCNIDIAKIQDKEIDKCTILKKKSASKFILMKLQYIDGFDFMDYLINQKNSIQLISNIILSYNHLLKSLSMLISKNIIHFDIKGTNILFDSKKEIPLIIDFGLSTHFESLDIVKLKKIFYIYAPEYYIWSLEIHYLSYLLNKNKEPTKNELTIITEEFVKNNKPFQKNFSPTFLKKYQKKCLTQLIKYNNMEFNKRIQYIISYWKSFDNYSLSIMYLKFLRYINFNGFIDNKFIIFFSKLLLKNLDPNIENRLGITETIHTFNAFLYHKDINNIQTFENLTKSFIENKDNINNDIMIHKKNDIYMSKTMKIARRESKK